MNLNDYQKFAASTACYSTSIGEKNQTTERDKAYLGLGLAGEAGEVANEIKKEMRNQEDRRDKIIDELSDVLWYWVRLCDTYKITPEEVMHYNVIKLTTRQLQKL